MGWNEHARRRAAIRSVLERAEREPSGGLPFEVLPEVTAVFASRRELLLALHYDWTRMLWARIELLSLDADRAARRRWRAVPLMDARELTDTAWQRCAEQAPVLRRLLDRYAEELGTRGRGDPPIMACAAGHSAEQPRHRAAIVA